MTKDILDPPTVSMVNMVKACGAAAHKNLPF